MVHGRIRCNRTSGIQTHQATQSIRDMHGTCLHCRTSPWTLQSLLDRMSRCRFHAGRASRCALAVNQPASFHLLSLFFLSLQLVSSRQILDYLLVYLAYLARSSLSSQLPYFLQLLPFYHLLQLYLHAPVYSTRQLEHQTTLQSNARQTTSSLLTICYASLAHSHPLQPLLYPRLPHPSTSLRLVWVPPRKGALPASGECLDVCWASGWAQLDRSRMVVQAMLWACLGYMCQTSQWLDGLGQSARASARNGLAACLGQLVVQMAFLWCFALACSSQTGLAMLLECLEQYGQIGCCRVYRLPLARIGTRARRLHCLEDVQTALCRPMRRDMLQGACLEHRLTVACARQSSGRALERAVESGASAQSIARGSKVVQRLEQSRAQSNRRVGGVGDGIEQSSGRIEAEDYQLIALASAFQDSRRCAAQRQACYGSIVAARDCQSSCLVAQRFQGTLDSSRLDRCLPSSCLYGVSMLQTLRHMLQTTMQKTSCQTSQNASQTALAYASQSIGVACQTQSQLLSRLASICLD